MNNQDYNQLREASWRRSLTADETAALKKHLAADPSALKDWKADAELNRLLDQLPPAPVVASNFTAQVLQAARQANSARDREMASARLAWRGIWSWLPKMALAALVIGFTVLGYHQHQAHNRAALARNVVELARAVSADPQMLEDFESINRLSDSQPTADTELLVLMK